ncbi:translation initiation factor IF-2-like [Rousettus aegyptiacus]|uniref:translation initiation factor IF-2-like n=1 Tax=Rousettus aegyptiacus TaxID=9407 RepID=UPI00168D5953|nr:translation initiation factor IF-2-like [Rousettus aegyptiacus]
MSGLSAGLGRAGGFQGADTPVSPPGIPVGVPAALSSTVRPALFPPLEARSEAKLLPADGPARAIAQVPGQLAPDAPPLTPARDPGARVTAQSKELSIKREQGLLPTEPVPSSGQGLLSPPPRRGTLTWSLPSRRSSQKQEPRPCASLPGCPNLVPGLRLQPQVLILTTKGERRPSGNCWSLEPDTSREEAEATAGAPSTRVGAPGSSARNDKGPQSP